MLNQGDVVSARQAKQQNKGTRLRTFQNNIYRLLYESGYEALFDIVITSENRELRAHKTILSASSGYFKRLFCSSETANRIEFQQRYVVVEQLLHCLYGNEIDAGTDPEIVLEVLAEARNLEVNCISIEDCISLIIDQLTIQNCARILTHEEVAHHRELSRQVCSYIVKRFSDVVRNPSCRQQLLQMPRNQIVYMIRELCRRCDSNRDTDLIVKFVVDWSKFESACDLVRDCKHWDWKLDAEQFSSFRDEESPSATVTSTWRIQNLRAAMHNSPSKIVIGTYFDWEVRLDLGAENRVRIVYGNAYDRLPLQQMCIKRFPSAMFAWKAMFRGENIFKEKPVFVCFPQNIQLHWSTALPIQTDELSEDDELSLMVTMTEIPLVSLILYYFSSDIQSTLTNEDILNRLPHIEFRCLSSYSLLHNNLPSSGTPTL